MWIFLVLAAVTALIYLIQHRYSHWERKNIPHEKPGIPFGSLDAVRRKERSFGLVIFDIYMRSKEQIVGVYLFFRPALLVRDAALARKILTTEFSSFHDRGVYVDEKNDPMSASLFTSEGQSWRASRTKLAPAFSSGKLKGMFGAVNDVGDKLVAYLNDQVKGTESRTLEMQDIFRTYAIDIIGSVIFGLDIDSFANPNNEFRKVNNMFFERSTLMENLFSLGSFVCPPIVKLLVRLGYKEKTQTSLRDIVKRTVENREQNKIVRKDLLQLLIQLRNTGKINDDDDDKNWNIGDVANGPKSMSIEAITAQSLLFYLAGSETTAATAAFTLYELTMYPELLKRAQKDVTDSLEKHALKPTDPLTYEAVQDMKFLDLCIMETTRKYPGLPVLNRECTQEYKVPGTNYTIAKGTPILISLLGLHLDPEHFPNPLDYDPDRFLEKNYNTAAYMPFGEGPRVCIAQRMGKINAKVAVVKLLMNFNIETKERKELEFEFSPTPVLVPIDGLKVRLSKKI